MTRLHTLVHRVRDAAHELRRRHVFRVGLAYSAMTWLVLQVATSLSPILDLNTELLRLLTLILALGFPLALALAWAYDITPQGIQRTASGESDEPTTISAADAPSVADVGHSVAALPFADRSADGAHRFLGDGITDELINGLSRVAGLRVVARTSAFACRDSAADARQIGQRLHVRYLIDGSVAVSGERLRVHAQLVDTRNGYTIWSDTYDRSLADIFTVQEQVARAVLRALQPHLDRSAPLLSLSTGDVEAYTSYLRGRSLWNERTSASLRQAIGHFEEAIARDPGFAHAYAGLADCHAILVDYAIDAPAVGMPRARAAAVKALAIAPELAESLTSAALVQQLDGEWHEAERELRAALDVNPGYTIARHRLALLLAWTGRSDEARVQIAQAVDTDPLSPVLATSRGWIEYYAGAVAAAREILEGVVAENPNFAAAHVPLALSLICLGDAEAAATWTGRHLALAGRTAAGLALDGLAQGRAGRTDAATVQLHTLQQLARSTWISPWYLAVAALGVADEDLAARYLERAAQERTPQLIYLSGDPLFQSLRARPDVRDLLAAATDHQLRS